MHNAPAKRRFPWFRFSLRTMLLLVMLVGIGLAFLLRWDESARRQRETATALESESSNLGWVNYEDNPYTNAPTPLPQWLGGLLLIDHFYNVVDVKLFSATDDQMRSLKDFPKLERLSLCSDPECTEVGLAQLQSLKNLKRLDLGGILVRDEFNGDELYLPRSPELYDPALAVIGSIKGLQYLDLHTDMLVTDAGLAHIGKLSALETLRISPGSRNVTDAGLANLSGLVNLKRLELRLGPDVRDEGLALLSDCPSLRQLKLGLNACVTGEGLANLKRLEYLELNFNIRPRDAPLFHLQVPMNVEKLLIDGGTCLVDEDLACLAELAKLRHLDLFWHRNVTDEGRGHLKRLTQLTDLIIHWDIQTTNGSIPPTKEEKIAILAELRTALPNCRITLNHPYSMFYSDPRSRGFDE